MTRIKKIISALKNKNIKGYKITEVTENSYEQFYDKGSLETVRCVKETLDYVTLYVENVKDNKTFVGQADFTISHNITSNEMAKLIDDCISQASYIYNEPFDLVQGQGKKSYSYKELSETPTEILQKISKIFFANTNEKVRFNSLECFFKETSIHLVNSCNVDLKKKTYTISVEAIPSYYDDKIKTELYRMFKYDNLDYAKIEKDAKQALLDVDKRGQAVKIENVNKCSVILRAPEIQNLFSELIDSYSYQSVYNHANLKSLGDSLQTNPYEQISLSLTKKSNADFFDGDGVILSKHEIIENSTLKSYFGPARFAQYLNCTPTGNLPKMILKTGKKSTVQLKKNPYIEIIDLSGIQVDAYANYIGGEVRLAVYFDGKNYTPISGFSFSSNLENAINHMYFSKEKEIINNYEGPVIVKIDDVDIL